MATFGIGVGGGDGGGGLVDLAPVATTSGTYKDVTEIAADAVFVAIILNGVSASESNRLVLKLGTSDGFTGQPASASFALNAADVAGGTAQNMVVMLRRVGTTNTWVASGGYSGATTLTGALERVQITLHSIGNSDAFDAGQIAVQYSSREGVGPIATTDDLPEGSNNHYSTTARIDTRIGAADLDDLADVPTPLAGKQLQRNAANNAWDLVDPADIESVFGITGNPAAGNIIKRNAGNTAWVYAADGGGGGGGSGIALTDLSASGIVSYDNTTGAFSTNTAGLATAIDGIVAVDGDGITKEKSGNTITLTVGAIPQKAGRADLDDGTNDTKFVTPKGVATMTQTAAVGITWALTYDAAGDLAEDQIRENATAYQYTIKSSDENETEMDKRFHPGALIKIERDASNYVRGRVQWADKGEGESSDEFVVQVSATDREVAGDVKVDGATVNVYAQGALFPELQSAGFVTFGNIVEGTGVTKGARQSNGNFTISATGTSIAKASKPEALAGTDDAKFMTPLRVHDVVEHLAHVETYVGMQYTTSQAGEMAVGTFAINSAGTRAWFRGHDQAQAEQFARDFLVDRYFIMGRNGQRIEAQFTDATTIAVSGSNVGVVQCDITKHSATPANPSLNVGDDWTMVLLAPQVQAIFANAPHAAITMPAIAPGAVGPVQVRGLEQECLMYMDNDSSGRNQNINDTATTTFGTATVTNDTTANAKSWAIGGGTNNGEHFDRKHDFTLIGGTPDFVQFRAEDGGVYSVRIDGEGVFYMKSADGTVNPRAIGLEVGLQFGEKDPAATDWSAWAHCGNADISRTINGASTLVYDASNFQGNASFLSQSKSVYRTKGAVPKLPNANVYADIGPPFWGAFTVGGSWSPFPVTDRDYRFRFVFFAPSFGINTNEKVWIQRIYNYTEKLVATRRA